MYTNDYQKLIETAEIVEKPPDCYLKHVYLIRGLLWNARPFDTTVNNVVIIVYCFQSLIPK